MQRLHESQGPYYPVKEILDESETRYKIWWDGIDPDTKRPWKIDWQPKECANKAAIEDWEEKKRQRRKRSKRLRSPRSGSNLYPRKSRIRPSRRRFQVLSSPSQCTGASGQPTLSKRDPLNQPSDHLSQVIFSAKEKPFRVKVTLPTASQREHYKTQEEHSSGEPIRLHCSPRDFEIPDSQPQSPVVEPPNSQHNIEFGCEIQAGTQEELQRFTHRRTSTPILESIGPFERNPSSTSPVKTPSPSNSASQAFVTQIAFSGNCLISSTVEDIVAEDIEQDRQGVQFPHYPASTEGLETLSISGRSHKQVRSLSGYRRASILTPRDPNSQSTRYSQSTSDKKSTQFSKKSEDQFLPVQSRWTSCAFTAQENIIELLSLPADSTNDDMASIRPSIDSLLTNDSPPGPKSSGPTGLRDQVRNARVLSAANTTALRASLGAGQPGNDSRSPSIIPEPIQYKPVGDSRLEPQITDLPAPRQLAPLSPHAPHKPSKLSSPPHTAEVDNITQLDPPKLGHASYIVSLPLNGRVREQYYSMIHHYQRPSSNIISMLYPDEATVKGVEKMLIHLDNITNHVDLEDESVSSNDQTPKDESNWTMACNAKFRFLKHLLHQLREEILHIAIVAQPGRLLEILERFIIFNRLANVTRIGSQTKTPNVRMPAVTENPLRVTLVGSANVYEAEKLPHADLVIAFDSTFNPLSSSAAALRRHPMQPDRLSPVIYPMVYSAVEHIERCIPSMRSHIDQLRVKTQCILQTQGDIGELLPEEASPEAAAEEVAAFLIKGGTEQAWTLCDIRPIELTGLELELAPQVPPSVPGTDRYTEILSRKRYLDALENEDAQTKRRRVTPNPDATHISNSLPSPNSEFMDLRRKLAKAEAALSAERKAHADTGASLQSLVDTKEREVREQAHDIHKLQTRYEHLHKEQSTLRNRISELERGGAQQAERCTKLLSDLEEMREDRNTIRNELKAAQERLEKSEVPEIAQLQRLQLENKKLANERAAADRRAASAQGDQEYAQKVYQDASSSAVESAKRIKELEAQLALNRSLATGEAVKLKKVNNDEEVKQYQDELARLNAEVEALTESLRKKGEVRGRGMNTRGGSVAPRSPRLGNVSPARSRANSRTPGMGAGAVLGQGVGAGSRPVSPMRSLHATRKGRGTAE